VVTALTLVSNFLNLNSYGRMRLELTSTLTLSLLLSDPTSAFTQSWVGRGSPRTVTSSQLHVSVGLGPQKKENEKKVLVAGVDYEVPDHESFRTSRRSKQDEKCDEWFGTLLGTEDEKGILGSLTDDARSILLAQVPLVNEVCSGTIVLAY
jgi:hypothetical protein